VPLGPVERAILHALALCRDGIAKEDLYPLLSHPERESHKLDGSLRELLSQLRKSYDLDISAQGTVKLVPGQPSLEVDYWKFVDLVGEGRHPEAEKILARGRKLCLPPPGARNGRSWAAACDEFRDALKVQDAFTSRSVVGARAMLHTREALLSRQLVPGFLPPFTINQIRELLEPLQFAWEPVRAPEPPEDDFVSLPTYLRDTLVQGGAPSQMIVLGPPGSGKELMAIAGYLLLTDDLAKGRDVPGQRTVLFIDARIGRTTEGFGTDSWLEQRLIDVGADPQDRPIVIMPHADVFFANEPKDRLPEMLGWRLFSSVDTLLCCNEQFYAKTLSFHGYGTHEIKLKEWEPELQEKYVSALHGRKTLDRYKAWRNMYASRGTLCRVPLHLNHVVALMAEQHEALQDIDKRCQLYERVAKVRMDSAKLSDKGALLDDLASLAHRFYQAGEPTERSISFSDDQLREHLKRRNILDVDARVKDLTQNTVLDADQGDRWRFHDMLWGWFFVAHYLVGRLKQDDFQPADVLLAFGKFLSASVMDRCEEMLLAWPDRDYTVLPALHSALELPISERFTRGRARVAREQIGYLLGVLAGDELRARLEARLDPESDDYESDVVVHRGIAIGLSNNDAVDVAERYVEMLRAEIAAGGDTPRADANIGCVLSFRGDRPFDYEHPEAYGEEPDPRHTVADLITGLKNVRHRGTWRIKLFTLVDIAQRVSPGPFQACTVQHRAKLEAVLDTFSKSMVRQSWPEIAEMRAVLGVAPPASD
jgi:hypothetical protein